MSVAFIDVNRAHYAFPIMFWSATTHCDTRRVYPPSNDRYVVLDQFVFQREHKSEQKKQVQELLAFELHAVQVSHVASPHEKMPHAVNTNQAPQPAVRVYSHFVSRDESLDFTVYSFIYLY